LLVITKRKVTRIKREFAKLMVAQQSYPNTIKKKFVRIVSGRDLLSVLCPGAGLKNKPEETRCEYLQISFFSKKCKSYSNRSSFSLFSLGNL
jgi:hypothetical protein